MVMVCEYDVGYILTSAWRTQGEGGGGATATKYRVKERETNTFRVRTFINQFYMYVPLSTEPTLTRCTRMPE